MLLYVRPKNDCNRERIREMVRELGGLRMINQIINEAISYVCIHLKKGIHLHDYYLFDIYLIYLTTTRTS